ncbi:universal stress protein [Leifsonia sp. NPDC080035]|uniref:Universal stress protein n=1 Tax=Leifsonia sp. NPDC080035 TaxID=3143936 RepID=A0AAU7G8G3_9MICO
MTTSTPRILVGYTATPAGEDALAAGSALAASIGAVLDVVLVLPETSRRGNVPNDPAYDALLRDTAEGWLADARTRVPSSVAFSGRVAYGDSLAEGLLAAAQESGASLLVVGAARGGLLGRFTVGSVAGAVLHAASVPVLLAPEGWRERATELTRVTCMVGTRAGAADVLATGERLSAAAGVPLRLVSLLALDLPGDFQGGRERVGEHHAASVLEEASAATGVVASAVVAKGDSIQDAVARLEWLTGEVVLVGSSRLAQPNRLFLGSTAAAMLRELPVPMIVVPRGLA